MKIKQNMLIAGFLVTTIISPQAPTAGIFGFEKYLKIPTEIIWDDIQDYDDYCFDSCSDYTPKGPWADNEDPAFEIIDNIESEVLDKF